MLLGSCSLQVLERVECASDEECADVFGLGATCVGAGFCEAAEEGDVPCTSSDDCLAQSGFGTYCAGATDAEPGLCEEASVLARCSQGSVPPDLLTGEYPMTIPVGIISDRSIQAHVDRDNAILLAISQLNEAGGIDGNPIGAVLCDIQTGAQSPFSDSMTRPDAAVAAGRWLVEQVGVTAILGPYESGDAEVVYAEVINDADLRGQAMLMTPSATDPAIAELDVTEVPTDNSPGLLWRTASSGTNQVQPLADALDERGVTSVAIVREASPFAGTFMATGQSLAQSFVDVWPGEVEQFTYAADSGSEREEKIREAGAALADGTADAVMFIGPTGDTRAFLAQATEDADFGDDVPIALPDTGALDEVFNGIDDPRLFDNVIAVRPRAQPGFVRDNFAESYQARYDNDPARTPFTAHAYDAAWFVALGLVFAAGEGESAAEETVSGYPVLDGQDVAAGLRRTVAGPDLRFVPSEWTTGISQLGQGRTVDVEGAASEYAWDLTTEEVDGEVELVVGGMDGTFMVP